MAAPSIRARCIFCKIVDGLENTEIIYKTNDVYVFRDIRPAAKNHLLAVSREHLVDAKSLLPEHKTLVQNMITAIQEGLKLVGDDLSNVRYGFHWPPFHSVSHLHLHAISPEIDMGLISRMIFKVNSLWFVTKFFGLEAKNDRNKERQFLYPRVVVVQDDVPIEDFWTSLIANKCRYTVQWMDNGFVSTKSPRMSLCSVFIDFTDTRGRFAICEKNERFRFKRAEKDSVITVAQIMTCLLSSFVVFASCLKLLGGASASYVRRAVSILSHNAHPIRFSDELAQLSVK